jgi:hypothetical protein
VTFYKWAGKLLKRQGKLAVAQTCCCEQWYCVLTQGGDYECRDAKPDPNENAQILSEHKTEKECLDQCYERYYCIDENGDYQCVKESDLPPNATIVSGPQRKEECEAKCENCPPCGNEACEAEAKGDDTIIEECCFNLDDEEEWTFNGTDWELTQRCGNDERTPCKGRPVPSFPQGLNAGDVFTLSCVPDGRKPEDNRDCEKCLYDCDKTSTPYSCVYTPDDGTYTEKECDTECVGKWYCKSPTECEQQNPPANPAKQGFDTESECVSAAPTDCAPPPERCCAVCEEPLVGGVCPPGFVEKGGKCVKELDYNCDPQIFAQIIADYPECQSGFQSINGPCSAPPPPDCGTFVAERWFRCTANNTDPTQPNFPFDVWKLIPPPPGFVNTPCPDGCLDPTLGLVGQRCGQLGQETNLNGRCLQKRDANPLP